MHDYYWLSRSLSQQLLNADMSIQMIYTCIACFTHAVWRIIIIILLWLNYQCIIYLCPASEGRYFAFKLSLYKYIQLTTLCISYP